MHALPSHPRNPLIFGALALALALMLMAAAAPELGGLELSLPGSGSQAPSTAPELPSTPQVTAPADPTWMRDPLAAPLESLAR